MGALRGRYNGVLHWDGHPVHSRGQRSGPYHPVPQTWPGLPSPNPQSSPHRLGRESSLSWKERKIPIRAAGRGWAEDDPVVPGDRVAWKGKQALGGARKPWTRRSPPRSRWRSGPTWGNVEVGGQSWGCLLPHLPAALYRCSRTHGGRARWPASSLRESLHYLVVEGKESM